MYDTFIMGVRDAPDFLSIRRSNRRRRRRHFGRS
jgi:hypothetical protein